MRSTAGVLSCAFLSSFCFAVALASATTQRSFSPAEEAGLFVTEALFVINNKDMDWFKLHNFSLSGLDLYSPFPGTFPRGAVACRVGTAPGQRNPSKEWAISFGFVDSSGGAHQPEISHFFDHVCCWRRDYSFELNFAANRTTGSPVHEQDHISRAGGPPLDIYVGFTSFVSINTTGVGLLFSWDYTLLH